MGPLQPVVFFLPFISSVFELRSILTGNKAEPQNHKQQSPDRVVLLSGLRVLLSSSQVVVVTYRRALSEEACGVRQRGVRGWSVNIGPSSRGFINSLRTRLIVDRVIPKHF